MVLFRELSHACLAHPISFAKTARYRLKFVGELLSRDPDLKVVALFRDPRGFMNSRWGKLIHYEFIDFNLRFN